MAISLPVGETSRLRSPTFKQAKRRRKMALITTVSRWRASLCPDSSALLQVHDRPTQDKQWGEPLLQRMDLRDPTSPHTTSATKSVATPASMPPVLSRPPRSQKKDAQRAYQFRGLAENGTTETKPAKQNRVPLMMAVLRDSATSVNPASQGQHATANDVQTTISIS
jgi:hypothetical protein